MRTVTLSVDSRDAVTRRALAALKGRRQGEHITFASPDLLWKTLTGKRWDLLQIMVGQGPMAVREAARRAGRDVKAVHRDVHILLDAGILDKTDDGRVVFPYDAVHVDFLVRPAEVVADS